ncbi:MAG: DegT/DnrJ/EryC1/StrS family aminotransferase, partial [Actinomycetota bacterium]
MSSSPEADRVRVFDGAAEARRDDERLIATAERVILSGQYILGPEVAVFETELAAFIDPAVHAVSCASGTDALWLALRALGIGHGDAVVVPAFTFFATASAVLTTGATPVFCDIDRETFNMDPVALERILEGTSSAHRRIGVDRSMIKAVIPVHLYGQPADMDVIRPIADSHGVAVVEDAAQALGADLDGRTVGTLGAVACFSFFPTKNLGGFGDGGAVVTADAQLGDRLRALRAHGGAKRYSHEYVGTNSRLDALQAAMLRVRLEGVRQRL